MSENLEIVGIEFDTTQFEGASKRVQQELDQLTQAENAYANAQRLSREEVDAASAAYDELYGATEDLNDVQAEAIRWNQHFDQVVRAQTKAVEEAHTEALRMNAAIDEQNKGVLSSVTGLGQLNNTLASSARQLAGVHPVVGQLVSSLGGLALGTGVTTGVLLFLTALAAGWREVTEAEREAGEETERSIARMDALVAESGPGEGPGDVRGSEVRLAELQAEMAELRQRRDALQRIGFKTPGYDQRILDKAFESATERERLRVMVDDLGADSMLPEFGDGVEGSNAQRERSMARRRAIALREMQADLAARDEAEQAAATAVLEHERAVEELTNQLELERITLTEGEAAAFRMSLALQGWTTAEIEAAAAAFDTNQAIEAQRQASEEAAQAAEEHAQDVERAMQRMADVTLDSLFDIIGGTDSVAEAFADMIESIVSEIYRDDLQKGLANLFGSLFSTAASGGFSADQVGAAIDFSNQITPTFGVMSGSSAGVREIHHQVVNLNVNAIDGRDAARFLEQNRGVIAGLVRQTVSESSRF